VLVCTGMTGGLTTDGIAALEAALAGHVALGEVPGLVALVARGDDVHISALGHKALGDPEPIGRDTIFRIASMTKPIVGVAAMLLVEDGAMALGDPVARWLPELAEPRVLRTLTSDLDDTVPAQRPVTVEDVLSFHLGFGNIMTQEMYPVMAAEARLGLKSLGPPWPPSELTPDEWLAALASLPLMDQPGTWWRYNTSGTVAGILIGRVAGKPLADVLAARIFGPLGMTDTGFYVPEDKLSRFATFYQPNGPGASLRVIDEPRGWYSAPPKLPDASSWLVSTIDDLHKFTTMMASGELLSATSRREMLRDRMTEQEHAESRIFVGEDGGWGLMISVPRAGAARAGYGWDGGSGTTWRTDPVTGLTGILLTQRQATSPAPNMLVEDFWTHAYAAVDG
jgi:CubicO group peptidase (beta-lactamase class C family)